ncbi:fucose 4-O-acetylase-like acetyltransferase [Marmoricola sp. OAE513]|uniref:acyltransferase family protein n=1 Tax=Marmoricola sp. OAE513 TaxID=2817894 RepID=UPI001AE1055F
MTTLRSQAVLERENAAEAPAARRQPRRREPWFDNIKMVLVTLVVVGHAWAVVPSSPTNDWAYDFLYSWHMPAFAIITGYFSRRFSWTPERLRSLVTTVAVPYLIFEAALAYYREWLGGVRINDLFADPHWPMWYLAALFFWRLSAPLFLAVPRWAALGGAVAISITSGLWVGETLDGPRILGMLPFFVLGLRVSDRDWARLRSPKAVPWALVGMAALLVLARYTDAWLDTEWYYYRTTYDLLQPDAVLAMATRAAVLAIGLVGAASVFALVPRGRSWFSTLGSATLVVYLFHGFVLLFARYHGYPEWAADHLGLSFAIATAAGVVLALLLAAPPVARRLNAFVDPIGWWEKRRDRHQTPRESEPREPAATTSG